MSKPDAGRMPSVQRHGSCWTAGRTRGGEQNRARRRASSLKRLVGVAKAGLLVVALIAGALIEPSAAAVPPYDPARFYPTEADFARSIAVYERAIAADPQDGEAYFWLGDAYWLASELYRLGLVSYGAGYLDKAIALLERATGIDDKNLGAWIVLVEAYRTRADRARGDPEKEAMAEARLIAASFDLRVSTQAVPPSEPLR